MSSPGPLPSATVQYASIYLTLFGLGYLRVENLLPSTLPFTGINPASPFIFGITFGLTLVGAMGMHAANLSLYGNGGPERNPKMPITVHYHRFAIFFTPNPGLPPGSLNELIERVENRLSSVEGLWGWFKLCIRPVWMIVSSLTYGIVTFGVLWILGGRLLQGGLDYAGGVLFITLLIFKLRSLLFGRFGTPVPEDAAEWAFVPEHRRAETLKETEGIEFKYDPTPFEVDLDVPDNFSSDEPNFDPVFIPLPGEDDVKQTFIPLPDEDNPGNSVPSVERDGENHSDHSG